MPINLENSVALYKFKAEQKKKDTIPKEEMNSDVSSLFSVDEDAARASTTSTGRNTTRTTRSTTSSVWFPSSNNLNKK